MNSWYHAQSAARKWGGNAEDYLPIHEFIDSSKEIIGDVRHRSMFHHTKGVWLAQSVFGKTISVRHTLIPVRLIAEQHIMEDLGWLPSPKDYIDNMDLAVWMGGKMHKVFDMTEVFGQQEENSDK